MVPHLEEGVPVDVWQQLRQRVVGVGLGAEHLGLHRHVRAPVDGQHLAARLVRLRARVRVGARVRVRARVWVRMRVRVRVRVRVEVRVGVGVRIGRAFSSEMNLREASDA